MGRKEEGTNARLSNVTLYLKQKFTAINTLLHKITGKRLINKNLMIGGIKNKKTRKKKPKKKRKYKKM
jgi:NADH:ubiquinone oxidoreductase subunit D